MYYVLDVLCIRFLKYVHMEQTGGFCTYRSTFSYGRSAMASKTIFTNKKGSF
jgi:hypothetical protein